MDSGKLKQVTCFQMQQGIHPYSFGDTHTHMQKKKSYFKCRHCGLQIISKIARCLLPRHSCIVPQPRSGAQCICQGAAVRHRGSHFKKHWKGEGLQLHIGMRDLAGVA